MWAGFSMGAIVGYVFGWHTGKLEGIRKARANFYAKINAIKSRIKLSAFNEGREFQKRQSKITHQ